MNDQTTQKNFFENNDFLRFHAAAAAMTGLLACSEDYWDDKNLADVAVRYGDALLRRLRDDANTPN